MFDTPNENTEVLAIGFDTPDGPLRARVGVPTGPIRLVDLISPLQQFTEGVVGLAIRREKGLGFEVSCQKGHAVCCKQLVPLSGPEAFYLRGLVNSLPQTRKREVLERFRYATAKVEEAGLMNSIEGMEDMKEVNQALAQRYFSLDLYCPFLEDDACSIHPDRPFACREYNVTSPPSNCTDPFTHPISKISVSVKMTSRMTHIFADLTETPPTLIPLTLSLGWAMAHSELGERTWPGISLFQYVMEQVSRSQT